MEGRRAGTRSWRAAAATALVSAAARTGRGPWPRPRGRPPTPPHPPRPPRFRAARRRARRPTAARSGGEELDTRGVVVDDDAPALPAGLAASGWLIADAESGTVLAARDPHGRFYPASTLKTLTLLTLLPMLDPAEVVTATAEDEQVEGSRVGIVAGGRYSVELLFQGLVLQSGNDAANALARTAGGVEETVEAMNETAEELGAFDTVAGSPSGLDVAGQSSSPVRPGARLPGADRGAGRRRDPADPDGADAAGARPLPRLPDPEPGPAARHLPRHDRREDRLHRRRPAHVRGRGRAGRSGARRQRHGHREHARCGRPTRRSCCWTGASPCPTTSTGSANWSSPARCRPRCRRRCRRTRRRPPPRRSGHPIRRPPPRPPTTPRR